MMRPTRHPLIIIALCLSFTALAVWLLLGDRHPSGASGADPTPRRGGQHRPTTGGFAGYGWSTHADVRQAVAEAVAAAEGDEAQSADITFVVFSAPHRPEDVVEAFRQVKGSGARVFGWSSDYGLMAPDGYHASPRGVVGVLSMRSPGMKIGVGAARLQEAGSAGGCAVLALERAVRDAKPGPADGPPSLILTAPTYDAQEEQYVEAITRAAGEAVPVFGGTAAGTAARGSDDSCAIATTGPVHKGLAVAVFYCQRPFGWLFRGGFRRTSKSGTVTASDGRVIRQIDGRAALDVYDEWSGGRVSEAIRNGGDVQAVCALYPLCRVVGTGKRTRPLFVHAWPTLASGDDKTLSTSATLRAGDVVHFSEGSWNILLNRIGLLPQRALKGMSGTPAAAGLFICCEGVLESIPASHRGQIASLINRSVGPVPWIATFTWGEQGRFAGVGNYHGNLLTGMTLFPAACDDDR